MTREFLVVKLKTRQAALEALEDKFRVYLKDKGSPKWRWMTGPEVLPGDDGWRAYGRIEWKR